MDIQEDTVRQRRKYTKTWTTHNGRNKKEQTGDKWISKRQT